MSGQRKTQSPAPPRRTARAGKAQPPARSSSWIVEGLVPALQFQGANETLWPTVASFRWFCRQQRDYLVNEGALLEISGRAFVDVPKFQQAVRVLGRQAALKAGALVEPGGEP